MGHREEQAGNGKHRLTAELMEPAHIRQHSAAGCLSSPRKQLAFIKQTKSVCIPPVENAAGAAASLGHFHPQHS